jgi:vacuolar protein sorting-associated protein 18
VQQDETQRSLLCTWLTELYLDEMDELEQVTRGGGSGERSAADVRRDFQSFLIKYDSCLHQETTFSLISEHGRVPELLTYAKIKKDYDTVISHYVQSAVPEPPSNPNAQERYDLKTKNDQQALRELLSVRDPQQAADLFYKYSPLLMARVPFHTVNAWLKARDVLRPALLIPSLMRYKMSSNPPDHPNQNQAIRYLQYAVGELRCRDKSVHNYLVYLLTQNPEHEVALRAFLGDEHSTRFYDLEYALRQCLRHNRTRAVVLLYAAMGMYDQAVERALKVDVDLAMQQARKPTDNAELRKKLWLRIARHCVENHHNKQAMGILEECHLLSIDDILPFFPDFDTIDDFREPICNALSSYNQRIAGLIYRMDQATASAGLIREDIKLLRRKHCFVHAQQECDLCQCALMSSPFYVFACQHVFHADCLGRAVKARMDAVQKECLAKLEEEITRETMVQLEEVEQHGGSASAVAGSSASTRGADKMTIDSRLNELQEQLESMIAEECIFCSNYTISEVDQPFVDEADQAEIDAWSVV